MVFASLVDFQYRNPPFRSGGTWDSCVPRQLAQRFRVPWYMTISPRSLIDVPWTMHLVRGGIKQWYWNRNPIASRERKLRDLPGWTGRRLSVLTYLVNPTHPKVRTDLAKTSLLTRFCIIAIIHQYGEISRQICYFHHGKVSPDPQEQG